MSAGRRGRPYQVPEDRTSLRSATVDVDARVGWLLLMSRLHHDNTDLGLGGPFMAALGELGLQADRSAVSRWESGKMQPKFAVLTAYERVLELRPGQISSVVNAMRRAYNPEGQRSWAPVLDPTSEAFHLRLDQLLEVLQSDKATGPDWTEFGYFVCASDMLFLPAPIWRDLSYRLVDQLARSVGLAYLQRLEALRILSEHGIAERWLLRASGDYLSDPAVQIVNDPVGVLEISKTPEAAAVLLDKFLQAESESVFEASVPAIASKVADGQFTSTELERIEARLVHAMRHRSSEIGGLEELLVSMPESVQVRLIDAARGLQGHQELATVATHGEWVRPDTARRVAQTLADRLRATFPAAAMYDEDLMTPRLIREALFSARFQHRHVASLALLGSPFRGPLASALADQVDVTSWQDPVVPRMLQLLRYLAEPEQETALLRWIPVAKDPLIRDMLLTLGHLPPSGVDLSDLAARLQGDGSMQDRSILYALGMRQDRSLGALAHEPDQPACLRAAADWWLRQGGAIQD